MLLLMIERGMPIDIVLTADTGMEFPEMYDHLAKLDEYLYRERGIHLTMLRHPKGFEYMMFEEEKQKISSIENRQKLGVPLYGNGWPGVKVRWCTGQLKTHLISKEVNRLKGEYQALHYVGIAADEPKRIKNEQYPLVDWGITEAEALKLCYLTLLKLRGQDWRAANTLSLSGIYQPRKDGSIRFPAALEQYLKDNPCVERIVLCLDNDEPGRAASAAIQKELSEYEVIDNPPRSGKDYNDQLQLMKGICGRVRTRGGTAR